MSKIFKGIIGILIFVLIITHFFLLSFFFTPIPKAVNILFNINKVDFVRLSDLPNYTANTFLSDKDYQKDFLVFNDDLPIFQKIISSSLTFRSKKIFSDNDNKDLYLNVMDFGGNVIGLESASKYYFNKSVFSLTENEMVTLVNLFRVFGG